MKFRGVVVSLALAAAPFAAPVGAMADPPAVSAPTPPGPFIGAPTNDNPDNGQFSVNFDDQGRFEGIGTAPEHFASFDLTPGLAVPQAGSQRPLTAHQKAALQVVFEKFARRLKEVDYQGITQAAIGRH
jgi:hypothetical protein